MRETNGVRSPYYPILLLPVVSTATYLGVVATVIASVAAVAASLSFLLFIDWKTVLHGIRGSGTNWLYVVF